MKNSSSNILEGFRFFAIFWIGYIFHDLNSTFRVQYPIELWSPLGILQYIPFQWINVPIVTIVLCSFWLCMAFTFIGFFTRWSIWFQLPIVLCALLINFFGEFNLSNFIQSSIVFLLCVFFSFYGSGKHSLDYNFKMEH